MTVTKDSTVYYNMTLIDGTGNEPVEKAYFIVRGGRITERGTGQVTDEDQGMNKVDLSEKFVTPGLMNCHTHIVMEPVADLQGFFLKQTPETLAVRGVANLQKLLASGTTFVRDMGAPHAVDIKVRQCMEEGVFKGPGLHCSARMITMTGGHGWMFGREADGVDDVRKAAREQLKSGADVVKIMATGGVLTPGVEPGSPQLTEEEIRAGVEEAHKAGKKTASHAQGTTGIKNAVRAGIDSIEHGCFLDDEAVELMLEHGTYLVPTLAAVQLIVDNGTDAGIPEYAVKKCHYVIEHHIESFRKAHKAGVRIACGTDASTPFNGFDMTAYELVLMARAGMTPSEAIVSATKTSAELIGCEEEYGTLEKGKFADFLVLDQNPLSSLESLMNVQSVYKKGQKIVLGNIAS